MKLEEFIEQCNTWGHRRIPFLFIVDFELEQPLAVKLESLDPVEILFEINGFTNVKSKPEVNKSLLRLFQQVPPSIEDYTQKFNLVFDRLVYGDSFLTNLTIKTEVQPSGSLRDLFFMSKAKYKLLYKNEFLVFSPEIFVRIQDGKIFSNPMKGTIDASFPGAREKILKDTKELAEHVTIVDLIRNDLSQVAFDVSVKKFRYVEELKTNHKSLLQVSSEIVGTLNQQYKSRIGDILVKLLPAGSVSGAPKPKTIEIIKQAEQEKRGYYTGVFGYFDGEKLDSGVMIRFLEHVQGKYFYRSGGGITTQSVLEAEYREVIDKVYVPVD
jgi:para-aminobenzoate synthetase component 1